MPDPGTGIRADGRTDDVADGTGDDVVGGSADDAVGPDDVALTDGAVEPGDAVGPDGAVGPDDAALPDGAGYRDGSDDDDETEDTPSEHDPLRFHRWMRSSASGGILTGIALGLQHALEERREQPAFVMEAPGEPDDPDAPISLHFDPDDPTKTVAVIRAPQPKAPDEADRPEPG